MKFIDKLTYTPDPMPKNLATPAGKTILNHLEHLVGQVHKNIIADLLPLTNKVSAMWKSIPEQGQWISELAVQHEQLKERFEILERENIALAHKLKETRWSLMEHLTGDHDYDPKSEDVMIKSLAYTAKNDLKITTTKECAENAFGVVDTEDHTSKYKDFSFGNYPKPPVKQGVATNIPPPGEKLPYSSKPKMATYSGIAPQAMYSEPVTPLPMKVSYFRVYLEWKVHSITTHDMTKPMKKPIDSVTQVKTRRENVVVMAEDAKLAMHVARMLFPESKGGVIEVKQTVHAGISFDTPF